MARKTLIVTAGTLAVGYFTVRAVRNTLDRALLIIAEAIDDIDFDDLTQDEDEDYDEEPCVCGSTAHKSVRSVWVSAPGMLSRTDVPARLVPVLPVKVDLAFVENDPLAVHMTLTLAESLAQMFDGPSSTAWSFARDLLDTAISRDGDDSPVGEGDVSCAYDPAEDVVYVYLVGDQGTRHMLEVDAEAVRTLLENALRISPVDAEQEVDDKEIAELLDGER